MADHFIPFFEQFNRVAPAAVPETFLQYAFAEKPRHESFVPPIAPEDSNRPVLSKISLGLSEGGKQSQKIRLKAKLLSDLKNALVLSMNEEAVQEISAMLAEVSQSPAPDSPAQDALKAEGRSGPRPLALPQAAPNISVKKEGDNVTQIIVECGCGEIIPLDCVY